MELYGAAGVLINADGFLEVKTDNDDDVLISYNGVR